MAKILLAALVCCLIAPVTARAADESAVASIKTAKGSCSVHRGSQTIVATEGMHLQTGDRLETGADSHLAFIMRDGTRIVLGSQTDLTIDQFAYDPAHSKLALILNLGRGMLAYISGKIASFSPEAVRVQTPVASIGVRGTKFVIGLGMPEGTP